MIANSSKILLLLFLSNCCAYDILSGLARQVGYCFPLVHEEGCNTPINEAYTAKTTQVGDNPPYSYFALFTPTNPDKAEPLHNCGGDLPENSKYDPNADTILIAHGWLDGLCRTSWMREMKDQFFIRGNYNVILVDWTWGNTPDPGGAAQNSLVVGEQAAFVIQNIMKRHNLNGDKFHLMGHSYGTYLAGMAAKVIKDENEENIIRRVTFLDPAVAPVTEEDIKTGKLSHKNAKFVDVIHSNGGHCVPLNFGLITPLGHVDFYPHGGSVQVPCMEYGIATLLRGDLIYGLFSLVPMLCYHLHAIQYFKVSINTPSQFIGVRCESFEAFLLGTCDQCCQDDTSDCVVAGMDAEEDYFRRHGDEPREIRKYYFETENVCPYDEKDTINKSCQDKRKGSALTRLL